MHGAIRRRSRRTGREGTPTPWHKRPSCTRASQPPAPERRRRDLHTAYRSLVSQQGRPCSNHGPATRHGTSAFLLLVAQGSGAPKVSGPGDRTSMWEARRPASATGVTVSQGGSYSALVGRPRHAFAQALLVVLVAHGHGSPSLRVTVERPDSSSGCGVVPGRSRLLRKFCCPVPGSGRCPLLAVLMLRCWVVAFCVL